MKRILQSFLKKQAGLLLLTLFAMLCPQAMRAQMTAVPVTQDTTTLTEFHMNVFTVTTPKTGYCEISFSNPAVAFGVGKSLNDLDTENYFVLSIDGSPAGFRCEADSTYYLLGAYKGETTTTQLIVKQQPDTTYQIGNLVVGGTASKIIPFSPTISGNYTITANDANITVVAIEPGGDIIGSGLPSADCNLTAGKNYMVACGAQTVSVDNVTLTIARKDAEGAEIEVKEVHLGDTIITIPQLTNPSAVNAQFTFTPSKSGYYKFQISDYEEITIMLLDTENPINISKPNCIGAPGFFSVPLTADQTYYLGISNYMSGAIPNVTLSIDTISVNTKAVYTHANHTLTFYDTSKSARTISVDSEAGDKEYMISDYDQGPAWYDDVNYHNITVETVAFDTSFVHARPKTCAFWFRSMSNLKEIKNLENLNTDSVTSMSTMFSGCDSLRTLDLSGWNTEKVEDMNNMFSGCYKLTSLNLSGWNTPKVEDMQQMFYNCHSLLSLDLSGWNNTNVTDMNRMFAFCESLKSINLSGWNTPKVKNMSYMFNSCFALDSLNFSGCNADSLQDMRGMFANCKSLKSLNLSGWSLQNITEISALFQDNNSLRSVNMSNWNTPNLTNVEYLFSIHKSLRSVNMSNWNTPKMERANHMFNECDSLRSVNLSGWNTPKVKNMNHMFYNCISLGSLDLTGWNTENVTNMTAMFGGCKSLRSLDLTGWNTENVEYMNYTFERCDSLRSLNLSGWNTANVTTMERMFYDCNSLRSLNLSGWNTENVTDMKEMFYQCNSLRSLDLSSFNTANVTDMNLMFAGCDSLRTITTSSDFVTTAVTSSDGMFTYCHGLVGGMGTTYSYEKPRDLTYAHIDGGEANPGYFTAAAEAVSVTISKNCYTTDAAGVKTYYATFSTNKAFTVPEGVTVSEVGLQGNTLVIASYQTDDIVAANIGLLISSATHGKKYFAVAEVNAGSPATESPLNGEGVENILRPTGTGITADKMEEADANCKFYRLAYYDYENKTGLGFYYGPDCNNGEAFAIGANKAYLAVPNSSAAPARFLLNPEQPIATDVETVNSFVNTTKRLVNGQLVVVREGKMFNVNGQVVK